jgi:hypothetical protein
LKSYIIILALLFITNYFISDVYAYVDPGTGSLFIQALLGVLVGIGITTKIYWHKLKEKFYNMKK